MADRGPDKLGSSGRTDAVAFVEGILSRAMAASASDVHFEPTAGDVQIKFRLDGLLKEVERLPKVLGESVISRLKVLGGLLTYRNDIPQEGHLHFKFLRAP